MKKWKQFFLNGFLAFALTGCLGGVVITSPDNGEKANVDLIHIEGRVPSVATKVVAIYGDESKEGEIKSDGSFAIEFVGLDFGRNTIKVKALWGKFTICSKTFDVIKEDDSVGRATVTKTSGGKLIADQGSRLQGMTLSVGPNSSSDDFTLRIYEDKSGAINDSFSFKTLGIPFKLYPFGVYFNSAAIIEIPINVTELPPGVGITDVKIKALSLESGVVEDIPVIKHTENSIKAAINHIGYHQMIQYYPIPKKEGELRISTVPKGASIYFDGVQVSPLGDVALNGVESGEHTIKAYIGGMNEVKQTISFDATAGGEVLIELKDSGNNKPTIVLGDHIRDGREVDDNLFTISGRIDFSGSLDKAVGVLTLNDDDLFLQIKPDGTFNQVVSLIAGENTISLRVTPNGADTQKTQVYRIVNTEFFRTKTYEKWQRSGFLRQSWQGVQKLLMGGITVTLSWDKEGTDLDLHVFDPMENHAWYRDLDGIPGARIDRDDTDGFGPEIFTMLEPREGNYRVRVVYYSNHGKGPSTAKVKVELDGNVLFNESKILTNNGEIWDAYTIPVNKFLIKAVTINDEMVKEMKGAKFTTNWGENLANVLVEADASIEDSDITYQVFDLTNGDSREVPYPIAGREVEIALDRVLDAEIDFETKMAKPLKYKIVAKVERLGLMDEFVLIQSPKAQARQEFIDYRELYAYQGDIPEYDEFVTKKTFQNSGNFEFKKFNRGHHYRRYGFFLLNESAKEIQEAQNKYGHRLTMLSGWRNPRKSKSLKSVVIEDPYLTGNSVDFVPTVSDLPDSLKNVSRDRLYVKWKEFIYKKLCRGASPLTDKYNIVSHGRDSIHMEPKSTSTGKCRDLPKKSEALF